MMSSVAIKCTLMATYRVQGLVSVRLCLIYLAAKCSNANSYKNTKKEQNNYEQWRSLVELQNGTRVHQYCQQKQMA